MSTQKKKSMNDPATLVDGKLILSFPDASTPVVWQLDLSAAGSSSFEVQEEGKGYALVTKSAGATKKETIAAFAQKEEAVQALMATSEALRHAYGSTASNTNNAAHSFTAQNTHSMQAAPMPHQQAYPTTYAVQGKKSGIGKWIIVIVCLAVIGFLFVVLSQMQPSIRTTASGAPASAAATSSAGDSASTSSGVPVSADEFLRSR